MPRVTVEISEETNDWLDAEKDRTGTSKAQLGGECIELMHSKVNHIEEARSDVMQFASPGELEKRLDELEERVDQIEAAPMAHARKEGGASAETAARDGRDDSLDTEHRKPRETSVRGSERTPSEQEVRDQLEAMDITGRRAETRKARRDAALWAWEFLRDNADREPTSSEIANATFGAFFNEPIGYSTSERYPGYGLWDNFLRETLAELPNVEAPPERGSRWRFELV